MPQKNLSKKLANSSVQCLACAWQCKLKPGMVGRCGIRKNVAGKLKLLVWGRAAAVAIDPIEKKPLYHFLPGSPILSVGTVGCNFACEFCQNSFDSQISKEKGIVVEKLGRSVDPNLLVEYCVKNSIPAIAFTYNEPTIFSEWAVEIMKSAKKVGIKGVFVSNGYMSKKTLDYLDDYIDAYNIDLKSFKKSFYQRICHARLEPVLKNIREIYQRKKWLEITTLIVPNENDTEGEIQQIAEFIYQISPDIPWHLSSFKPSYKMLDKQEPAEEIMEKAYKIGKKAGLKYVYLYQASLTKKEILNTICPQCGEVLIKRKLLRLFENRLVGGSCPKCNYQIKGIWQ